MAGITAATISVLGHRGTATVVETIRKLTMIEATTLTTVVTTTGTHRGQVRSQDFMRSMILRSGRAAIGSYYPAVIPVSARPDPLMPVRQ
jgi:hypothetical protein